MMAAGALAACGGSDEPKSGAPGASSGSAPKGSASAKQVAKQARGDVDCPARIKSPARAADAPVDDVVGVRPGMTYDEAMNAVLCTHDLMVALPDTSRGFNIQTFGQKLRQGFSAQFAEPRVEKTSQQIMKEMQDDFMARSGNAMRDTAKPGQSRWFVGTMGMPGQERVTNAAREEWFDTGRNPTISSIEQALLNKYGTPTRKQDAGSQRYLTWSYDPFGRMVSETSPLFNRCNGNASPDGGVNLSPDCGIVVMAIVFPVRENPELAKSLQVGVVNQAGGYELVTATEQGLQQMEQQRRTQEVEKASKNANAPTL